MSKKKSANAKQETPGEILQRLDEEAEARVRVVDDTEEAALKQAASTTPENKEDSATKEVDEISKKAFEKTTVTDNSGEHGEDDALKINPAPMLKTDIDAMLGKGKKKKKGEKKETKGQKRVQTEARKPKVEPEKKPKTVSNGEAIQKYMTQTASVEELKAALKMAEEREAVERDIAIATGTATPEQCKDIVVIHQDVTDTSTPRKIVSETFTREFVNLRGAFNEIRSKLQAKHDRIMREYTNVEMRDLYAETIMTHIKWIENVCMKTRDVNFLKEEMSYEEKLKKHLANDIDPEKMLAYFKNARIDEILVPHDMHIEDVQAIAQKLMQKNAEFLDYLNTKQTLSMQRTMKDKLEVFEMVGKEKYPGESCAAITAKNCNNVLQQIMGLIA